MPGEVIFSIQREYEGRERIAIMNSCSSSRLGTKFRVEDVASEGAIPIGTVEFSMPAFGLHCVDFYPEFLSPFFHRSILPQDGPYMSALPWFAKRRGVWKDWKCPPRIYGPGEIIPDGDWWISSPVEFVQEWRYYIAESEVITTGWYSGDSEDEPAPKLDVDWPKGFSGAVDFGRLKDGKIALVEAHPCIAIGWYGDIHEEYAYWLASAWVASDWWRLK